MSAHSGVLSEKKLRITKEIYEDSVGEINEETNIVTYGKGAFHLKFGCSSIMQTGYWLCRLEPYTSLNFYSSD